MFKSLKGFSLLELIVVIMIIGILAGFALPRYNKVVERSRVSEAVSMLGSIHDSQMRYALSYGNYTSNVNALDININANAGRYFTFATLSPDAFDSIDQDVASATRNPVNLGAFSPNYKINITENGNLSSNDAEVNKLFL